MNRLLLIVIGGLLFATSAPAVEKKGDLARDIDELFVEWSRKDSPGFSVAVIRHGQVIHARGYGQANLDTDTPLTADSVFDTFSVTKMFTTVCVARLLDLELATADDDVRKFIPELHEFATPIRIRDLLRCRTGLYDYYMTMMLSGRNFDDTWTAEDVLDLVSRQKSLPFKPGAKWAYSNTDYFLLGLVVERASGKSIREFADEELFGPLKMSSTFFDDERRPLHHRNRVTGYARNAGGRFHLLQMNSNSVGPFGLMTTVADLAKWDAAVREKRLPRGRHVDAFCQDGFLFENLNCLSSFLGRFRGVKRRWYTGGGPGFLAHFARFPDAGLSIALLCKISEEKEWRDGARIVDRIAERCLADKLKPAKKSNGNWDPNPNPINVSDDSLDRFTGAWKKPDGGYVEFDVENGQLQLHQLTRPSRVQRQVSLLNIGGNRFRNAVNVVPYDLEFVDSDESDRSEISIRFRDGYRQKWVPVEFISPGDDQLQGFTGDYYAPDLESIHRITRRGSTLYVQYNFGRKQRLRPTEADTFIPDGGPWPNTFFRFQRTDEATTGYQVDLDRVKRLRFQKLKTSALLESSPRGGQPVP